MRTKVNTGQLSDCPAGPKGKGEPTADSPPNRGDFLIKRRHRACRRIATRTILPAGKGSACIAT